MEKVINNFVQNLNKAHESLNELRKLHIKQSTQKELSLEFLDSFKSLEQQFAINLYQAQEDFQNTIFNELILYLNSYTFNVNIKDKPYHITIEGDKKAYMKEIEGYEEVVEEETETSEGFFSDGLSDFQKKDYCLEIIQAMEQELNAFCTIDVDNYTVNINKTHQLLISKEEEEEEEEEKESK